MNLLILTYICLFVAASNDREYYTQANQNFPKTEKVQLAEKVYLHVDRLTYNSGDDIWFKAYVIDPSTNKPSANTNYLHVELISSDSKIILSRKVMFSGGTGNGDFHLADSIPSGQYRIRAYTNYMRNYDDHFFFMKVVTIINPYDYEQSVTRNIQNIENKIDISFFPEGGSLVDNVYSNVAIKAVNALGKGCDITGEIFTTDGDSVTSFKSTHLGMGIFDLIPAPGIRYYAKVRSQDGTFTEALLPVSFPTGLTMNALITQDKKLFIKISTNERTLRTIVNQDFNLLLSSRNLINKATKLKITSLVNNFLIPIEDFPEGIFKVTLTGSEGLPACERLLYYPKNEELYLNIIPDKNIYKPREKVKVDLSLTGDSLISGNDNFSVSIAEEQYTSDPALYTTSIASWFLLESDVRGPVEEPSYYFDHTNKNRFADLDLLLMTQGWRDFQWKYDSLSPFAHEIGIILSGTIKRIVNNNPIEGAKINLGLFTSTSSLFFDTMTDHNGNYTFEGLDITGEAEVFISSTDKSEKMIGRIFLDSISYESPEIEELRSDTIELVLNTKDYSAFQQEAVYKLNIKKKYTLKDTISIGEVIITANRPPTIQEQRIREVRRVYATPDKEVVIPPAMDNYSGDVFSFISGRVAGVQVVRGVNLHSMYYPNDIEVFIRGQFTMQKRYGVDYKRGALILLDGYEIDTLSLGKILSLPMFLIDRVDVLNASPLYGMSGANGVINIITRSGVRRTIEKMPPNSAYARISGFNAPRIFYSPKHDPKYPAYMPDTRTTLFWKPDVSIEKDNAINLEYYNADNPGEIDITVEGITEDGIPLSGKTIYIVK